MTTATALPDPSWRKDAEGWYRGPWRVQKLLDPVPGGFRWVLLRRGADDVVRTLNNRAFTAKSLMDVADHSDGFLT